MNPARRTLDPRAKLYLLLVANLMLFFHVGLATQIVMVVLFLLPLLAAARWRTALNFGVTYAVLTALGMLDPDALGLPWLHVVSALAVGVTMMLPCFITGAYTFTTTSASAFICAMRRMRVPEAVVIPCVVVIRFFPTIAEDYRQIRNAMALRGIASGGWGLVRHPAQSLEYILIPLLMNATNVAQDLSVAALTKGLGREGEHTSRTLIRMTVVDWLVMIVVTLPLALDIAGGDLMGGNQSQPNATAIIGTGKGGPLDTSAGTIASRGISFTYDHAAEPALRDITLTVPAGECIVLCGASGCGKTSYTRVANGLIPSFFHGAFAGNQTTCGLDVETVPIDRLTPLVGSVFQNPKTQYFNANVTDELAFPAENIGLPAEDINRRITAVAERFGIGHLLHRSIFHLSGGQKQRIAVAAATMLGPRVVVLDEPTSNLDANAIADMRAMIEQMKDEGLTIVIAEHRLAWLNGVADRYVVFDGGHIVQDYEADEFLSLSPGCVAAMGLRALDLQPYRRRIAALASSPAADECTSVLLGTHNLTIGYKGKDGFTRAIPDLRFRAGEITGLMGNNGCGKTTLVRTLTGLIKPVSGRIELNGVPAKPRDLTRAGFLVMQDVNYQLFSDSVREELLIGLDETDAGITAQANQVMADLDLAAFAERHPMSLSGGQKQRVAIGSALMCGKDLIIFDEPTSGLDRYHMEQVGELLRQLASQGKAILVVTHDEELAAGWCDRIVNLGADDSGNNGSHASNPDASSPSPNASTNFATTSTHERNAQ